AHLSRADDQHRLVAEMVEYLPDVIDGGTGAHLIPVEDYARLEVAVADALRETVGADDAQILEARLLQAYPTPFQLPPPHALLLALGQALPAVADAVRKRTRALYAS